MATIYDDLTMLGCRLRSLRKIFFVALCLITFSGISQTVITLAAVNDTVRTGPLQLVKKNIIKNDSIPGDNYGWRVLTSLPAQLGTLTVNGDYLVFMPAVTCRDTAFTVLYELWGSNTKDTASVRMIVAKYNNPANIIDPDIECFEVMPENVPFGIRFKYSTSPRSSSGEHIDGFTSPLVGDLNGDGKPEIVIMGNNANSGEFAETVLRYINIYNGQTGDRMYQYNFTTLGTGYSEMDMGTRYHRAPSILAIADLDNDGIGEIVMCHAESGRVVALKPNFSGSTITGMTKMWEGRDASDAIVSYKEPATSAQKDDEDYFGYPQPYIADLNGDGKPEVIVYNKIYNGENGRLLMAWQNAGTNKVSSYTSTSGLQNRFYADPVSSTNANNVRGAAMVGRRPGNGTYADRYLPVIAIVDIDGDNNQEIIAGNRIHKFTFNSLTDHTQNTYSTIEGPQSVTVPESGGNETYHLSDGFTRVADVDGDDVLDIIVVTFGNNGSLDAKVIVYVWDINDLNNVKACVSFGSDGQHGNFSIPFVGDINGKMDGWNGTTNDYTKKLPEICILGGRLHIDRYTTYNNRTGVKFHPKTDDWIRRGVGWDNNNRSTNNRRFNWITGVDGHIIGLTWDGQATTVEEKLKVSWGMEHEDRSHNTGITLFDFNNDNAADLCYRDETTLRVISPAKSGRDYVEYNETPSFSNPSVMFSTPVYSGTGFEYPVIADVNMDGSADIVVTHADATSRELDMSRGYIKVYEYQEEKWAPCPPVWNQGMYDPTQVREDLKINACPISMLKTYNKGSETIQPYNGSWMQRPIVRDEHDFVPVVRHPNAIVTNMKVKVNSTTSTTVTLDIFNDGSATLAASAPVYFYDGKTSGQDNTLAASTLIGSQPLGIDIFPDESRQVTFNISGNFNDHLIWATVIINKTGTPAAGYDDCDPSNNTFSGADCPYLIYETTALPDAVLCGTTDNVTLTATPKNTVNSPTYQWYRNDILISGATAQSYTATLTGTYKCFVTDGICRGFTPPITLTRETPEAVDDYYSVSADVQVKVAVLSNDKRSEYCNPLPEITVYPTSGTASVDAEGRIVYTANIGATADSLTYKIDNSTAKVYFHITNLPDNVIDPDCYTNPITAADWTWAMSETTLNSVDAIHNYSALTVGDIDGDDTVEIIGFRESTGNTSQGVKIFYFDKTEQKIKLKKDITLHNTDGTTAVTVSTYGSMAIARYSDKGYIIVAGTNNRLYAYDAEGNGTALWESDAVYNTQSGHQATVVGIADFDGNGTPEVYTGNTIFSIIDGHKICDGGTTGNRGQLPNEGCSSVAADIDGDGKPELCAGTQIYKVNIGAGTMSVFKELPAASLLPYAAQDGATQVADIDGDGNLDIIVVSQTRPAETYHTTIYVWTPDAANGGVLIGSYLVSSNNSNYGIPSIGNIDADAYPEIVLTHGSLLYALDYNSTGAAGDKIALKWMFALGSSSTNGISLFDFNLDGENEIIYRDGTKLEILIGRNTAASPLMQTATVYSGTLREFPVIADIDDDGHADVITTGRNTSYTGTSGYLRIFRSAGSPWSSARKVWNQYNYNVVNVHENLTVPTTTFNISQSLSSGRPFNSFRRQMGYINDNGEAKVLTPDVFCTQGSVLNYDAHQDILFISVHVRNTGDAALFAPFYISTYRKTGTTVTTPSMSIDSSMMTLRTGETQTILLSIRNFSEYSPFTNMDSVAIILNNRGKKDIFEQTECNYDNNYVTCGYNELLLAYNDMVSVIETTPAKVGILGNDSIPVGCTPEVTFTQPEHGTATFVDDSIIYTANQGYAGIDTVTYTLTCGDYLTSTAKLYIMVYYLPDNISDAECYTRPQSNDWNIKDVSPLGLGSNFATLQTPLVGDLDGDGKPEILMTVLPSDGTQESDRLWIINGDGTKKRDFSIEKAYTGLNSLTAIGRIKHPTSDTTIIVTLAETTHRLYAYNIYGSPMWTSSATYHASYCGATVQLVDVDGDGWTEIVVGNKIFAAESGELLCTAGTNEGIIHGWGGGKDNNLIQTVAGDVLGIGNQQLCVGNSIYRIEITNRNGTSGNSMTPAKSITPTVYNGSAHQDISAKTTDGATQLADFDLDGNLDIVVSTIIDRASGNNDSKLCIYIWSPAKNAIIASRMISRVYKRGVPFIGDVNGDGYPEIIVIRGSLDGNNPESGHDKITALRYNPANPNRQLEIFWELTHNDLSGATGITLFDFNQDGISELVYRDNTDLRIINGSLIDHTDGVTPVAAPYDLETISCGSATCFEYPVVADIDNDGEAEIVITGPAGGNAGTVIGPLRIFEAGEGRKWAPARTLWNQYSYNAVNVNEDLTIPKIPLSPAVVFPGTDGVTGTIDDIRPYNNFLQQQTTLNAKGNPIWPSPDATFAQTPAPRFNYNSYDDSLTVTLYITNTGNAALQSHLYITAYKDMVENSNALATDSIMKVINVGDTLAFNFTMGNLSSLGFENEMIIRINDRGEALFVQSECDTNNNTITFSIFDLLTAQNDTVTTTSTITVEVPILDNDIIPNQCTSPVIEIIKNAAHGTGTLNTDKDTLSYIPQTGFAGVDTITYRIVCDSDTATANVYVMVLHPLSLSYLACPGISVSMGMGFSSIENVQYWWYDSETGGTLIKATPSDTIIRVKDSISTVQQYWAEPRFDNVPFLRYPVSLKLADDCGTENPSGCGANGTVIFKEDFGGNEVSDPMYKPEGIPQMDVIYLYDITPLPENENAPAIDPQEYMIAKKGEHHLGAWVEIADHTYPHTNERGYFMEVNSSAEKGQFYYCQIDGLCAGLNLYFSAWIYNVLQPAIASGHSHHVNQIFILEDLSGNTIAQYYTGDILNGTTGWNQYGFQFTMPENLPSIRLRIINNGQGSNGNDFALDDIEVRLCVPVVTIEQPTNKDTSLCLGASLSFQATYTDNGTFTSHDGKLYCRWERNLSGDLNNPSAWQIIQGAEDSVPGTSISSSYSLYNVTFADSGYYRLAVADALHINSYNCRAMSDIIRVRVVKSIVPGTAGADQTICYNTVPQTLTSTPATGGSLALTYQWQQSTNGGTTWTNVTAGTDGTLPNYTPPTLTQKTQYRLITTAGITPCEIDTSDVITITVTPPATESTIELDNKAICHRSTETLTPNAPNVTNPVFNWFVSPSATTPFHTGASYTTSSLTEDTTFYLSVSGDNYCENIPANRKAVTVTVYSPLTGGTIGTSETYCFGPMTPAIFIGNNSPTGGSGVYSYQWQTSANGNDWNDVEGDSTVRTYAISGLIQTTKYRRIVIDSLCGVASSDTITVYLLPAISVNLSELCVGITAKLSPSTGGTWSSSDPNVAKITDNNTVEGISAGTAKLIYTASSSPCADTINITVNDFPIVAETTGKKAVCIDRTIELSNATPNGVWTTNKDYITITDPSANPVTIKGIKIGKTFVTYTVSNGICQTKSTFSVKIIPDVPPQIIIGIERK